MVKTNGGEPIKGELFEQYQKYSQFMKFNGKSRASLGLHLSTLEAIDEYRKMKGYLKYQSTTPKVETGGS